MKRITSIEQRCQQHILAAHEASALRDEVLSHAAKRIAEEDETSAAMDVIDATRLHQLLKMKEQATTTTRSLGGTAVLAERASKQVKQLDFLLSRVTKTREIANARQQQSINLQRISGAIEANDLELATECVQRYEEARKLLVSSSSPSSSNGARIAAPNPATGEEDPSVVNVDHDSIMDSARTEVAKMVRSHLATSISMNDKLKIVKLTSMLNALGFKDEACDSYIAWVCDHTIAQLKTMVSRELRNMDDPTAAGMSHLTLVSNALDHVVAAMEQEQQQVTDVFGSEGHLKLLQLLHSRCTHHCIPVVKDFLDKRRVLAMPRSKSSSTAGGRMMSPESKPTAGPHAASHGAPPTASLVDPRRIDECLEDISHLVSCCSLYMEYIEGEMATAAGAAAEAVSPSPTALSSDSQHRKTNGVVAVDGPGRRAQLLALATRDNALFDTIQELLSIYIPMQSEYFDAAFQQAVKLQQSLLKPKHSDPMGNGGSSSHSASSGGGNTFMGALSSLYGNSESAEDGEGGEDFGFHAAPAIPHISLVDDVFYFVRIAIHRAAGTKSTSILSAVIIAVVELVQSRLMGEVSTHIQSHLKKAGAAASSSASSSANADSVDVHHHHQANVPVKALAWLCSANQCQTYTMKIGEELHRLVVGNFPQPGELIRFGEQRHDLDLAAKAIGEQIANWIGKIASIMAQGWLHRPSERFVSTSYVVTESQYYQFDLADPWANGAVLGWGHSLDFLSRSVMVESVREQLIVEICSRVVKALEEMIFKKKYSAYGALQLDKDIRTVRQFFIERTERPVREMFSRLHMVTHMLLVDRPQEARSLFSGTDGARPSEDDIRRILSLRSDFDANAIAATVA
jgi:conserved oligomeric Golgi complex subunit 4